MVRIYGEEIQGAFTGGNPVNAIYSKGYKVWPEYTHWEEAEITPYRDGQYEYLIPGKNIWNDLDGNTYQDGAVTAVDGGGTKYTIMCPTLQFINNTWVKVGNENLTFGCYVWNDGSDIFMDRINAAHKKWVDGAWVNYTPSTTLIEGIYIWTDGKDIYNDGDILGTHCIYNSDGTWTNYTPRKTSGDAITDNFGQAVWDYEGEFYMTYSGYNYKLNPTTNRWASATQKDINGNTILILGQYVWFDGLKTYYSYESDQYVCVAPNRWKPKDWGEYEPDGFNIWRDQDNIYCTKGGGKTYKLA